MCMGGLGNMYRQKRLESSLCDKFIYHMCVCHFSPNSRLQKTIYICQYMCPKSALTFQADKTVTPLSTHMWWVFFPLPLSSHPSPYISLTQKYSGTNTPSPPWILYHIFPFYFLCIWRSIWNTSMFSLWYSGTSMLPTTAVFHPGLVAPGLMHNTLELSQI